jgi:hypothetical protein
MEDKRAPAGKFRVIGVDTFEGPFADCIIGDYDTREKADEVARMKAGEMFKTYVYDDKGSFVRGGYGRF